MPLSSVSTFGLPWRSSALGSPGATGSHHAPVESCTTERRRSASSTAPARQLPRSLKTRTTSPSAMPRARGVVGMHPDRLAAADLRVLAVAAVVVLRVQPRVRLVGDQVQREAAARARIRATRPAPSRPGVPGSRRSRSRRSSPRRARCGPRAWAAAPPRDRRAALRSRARAGAAASASRRARRPRTPRSPAGRRPRPAGSRASTRRSAAPTRRRRGPRRTRRGSRAARPARRASRSRCTPRPAGRRPGASPRSTSRPSRPRRRCARGRSPPGRRCRRSARWGSTTTRARSRSRAAARRARGGSGPGGGGTGCRRTSRRGGCRGTRCAGRCSRSPCRARAAGRRCARPACAR